jgi:hypothetical protein
MLKEKRIRSRIEESQQELPRHKWNKDVEGAWRMDINVGFIEDSNIKESVTNIDVRVESEAESSDSQSDKAESSASETDSDY